LSGNSNDNRQLNVVPTRMVQSADLQLDHNKYWLTIRVELLFQWHREDYRRTTGGNFRYFSFRSDWIMLRHWQHALRNPAVGNNPLAKLNTNIVIIRLKSLHTLQVVEMQPFIMYGSPCPLCGS
jgi:hypothetical protein